MKIRPKISFVLLWLLIATQMSAAVFKSKTHGKKSRSLIDEDGQDLKLYQKSFLSPEIIDPKIGNKKKEQNKIVLEEAPLQARVTKQVAPQFIPQIIPKKLHKFSPKIRKNLRISPIVRAKRHRRAKIIRKSFYLSPTMRLKRSEVEREAMQQQIREIHLKNLRLQARKAQSSDPEFGGAYATPNQQSSNVYSNIPGMFQSQSAQLGMVNYVPEGSEQTGVMTSYSDGVYTYTADYSITFSDVKSLIAILNSIGSIYNYYYQILPNSENPSSSNSKWEKAEDMVMLYASIRSFATTVINDREKLAANIEYLNGKISLLKASEDDMLKFFGINQRYYRVRVAASNFDLLDRNFSTLYASIQACSIQFETDVKLIMAAFYDFYMLYKFFEVEIDALLNNSHQNQVINVLTKVDSAIMLLARILEVKNDITLSIDNTKKGFKDLANVRNTLVTKIAALEALVEQKKLNELTKLKSSVSKIATCLLGILLLMW